MYGGLIGGLSRIETLPGFNFPSHYPAFQFVFVLLQSAAAGGAITGIAIAIDFQTGFSRRILLGARSRSGILAGYALAGLHRTLLIWVLLMAVGLIAGMQIDGSAADMFGLFSLAAVVNLASTMWAAGLAMRIRSLQAGPLMQMPILIIFFVAPVFVPVNLLTGWIHTVAKVNPVTALLEAGRGLISGRPELVALAFGIAVASAIGLALWARGGLRRAETAG